MAGDEVQLRLLWIDLDESPIYSANQFIGQVDADQVVVSLGSASPPIIIGDTPDERKEQAEGIGYVPVRPITRISLTRTRLVELIENLNTTLKNYDTIHGGGS